PNVIPYPGAPPTPPYDNAGWTLAFQVGVEFDRILEPFDGPFEKVTDWNVIPSAGLITASAASGVVEIGRQANDSIRAVNRLRAAGVRVHANAESFLLTSSASTLEHLKTLVAPLGVNAKPSDFEVAGGFPALPNRRIGLWDQYGGSMPSGWTRWILEQFEFPFSRVFAQ